MRFRPRRSRVCYNQSVVNDNIPEDTESFILSIVDNPDITIGDPGTTQINIVDDDGRELFLATITQSLCQQLVHSNSDTAAAL